MPTSTIPLPGASRTFLDSTEYISYHIFRDESAQLTRTYDTLRQQLKERIAPAYELVGIDGSDVQLKHKQAADDNVSVDITKSPTDITITFYPPSNKEIPWGDPCLKKSPADSKQ